MDRTRVVAPYPLFLADLRQPLQLLVLDDLGLLVLLDGHFHLHLHRQDVRWKTRQPREGPGGARLGLGRGRSRHSASSRSGPGTAPGRSGGRGRGTSRCLRASRKGARAGPLPCSEDLRLPPCPVTALSLGCVRGKGRRLPVLLQPRDHTLDTGTQGQASGGSFGSPPQKAARAGEGAEARCPREEGCGATVGKRLAVFQNARQRVTTRPSKSTGTSGKQNRVHRKTWACTFTAAPVETTSTPVH